jgi:probable F420-dependent oxidoreductase
MKVDTTMILTNEHLCNTQEIGRYAKKLEDIGFAAAFTFEGQHEPFLPLALAAQGTQEMELGTGIAVAFARNPMNLANLGYDLQLMTQGRFILGLGTQIQAHIEKRFSMQWSKPAARMKEMIQAIRAIWLTWETNEKLRFEGEFYRHTLMTPTFNPGPNPYGLPKIVAAGVGAVMTEAVSEVADGFTIHPFNTAKSLRELTLPAIQRGLAKNTFASHSLENHALGNNGAATHTTTSAATRHFEISCNVIIGSGKNEKELAVARDIVKKQIAFYGSTPAYRPVLECHGWGELQTELNRLSKLGKWDDMSNLASDEILDAIAIVGPRDEIAPRIHQKLRGVADRVNLVARYTTDENDWYDIVSQLKSI